MQGALVYKIS